MNLPRHGIGFLVVGGVQLLFDWVIFVASTYLGAPMAVGNVLGRVGGASFGFWLNGRFTFADAGVSRVSRQALLRFLVLWSATTTISTLTLSWLGTHLDLAQLWVCKPVVEIALAGVGFLAARHWIYRE